jgi:hypothetical protein
MRPAGMDPMVTSKNTTGLFWFGDLWCHSTEVAVADGGVGPAEMAVPPADAMEVLEALAPDASRRSGGDVAGDSHTRTGKMQASQLAFMRQDSCRVR